MWPWNGLKFYTKYWNTIWASFEACLHRRASTVLQFCTICLNYLRQKIRIFSADCVNRKKSRLRLLCNSKEKCWCTQCSLKWMFLRKLKISNVPVSEIILNFFHACTDNMAYHFCYHKARIPGYIFSWTSFLCQDAHFCYHRLLSIQL